MKIHICQVFLKKSREVPKTLSPQEDMWSKWLRPESVKFLCTDTLKRDIMQFFVKFLYNQMSISIT